MPSPSTEPIIEFKGIKKAFGQKVIYSGLNLKVARGEVLTICGGLGSLSRFAKATKPPKFA